MRPAFGSTQSAAAFALLLLVLLLSPVLVGKNLLPPREQSYSVQGWGNGPYPWIRHQIFEETNAIDIAFMGSSHMFNAINTPQVQAELTQKLGRPAVVRTIAWGGAGYDALYLTAKEMLAHRPVKVLVFYDEDGSLRNSQLPNLFRWGDDAPALSGLSCRDQSLFYFASIIGMPRNLLSLVRPNLPAPLIVPGEKNYWEIVADGPNPVTQLGALVYQKGFAPTPMSAAPPFVEFKPPTAATPADVLVVPPTARGGVEFSTAPLPGWQRHFASKLADLFRENHVQPVMLHLPVLAEAEARAPVLPERADWPQIFGGDFKLIGLPAAKLFDGLTAEQVRLLYGDPAHFNRNGQAYFTALITPALLQIYDESK